MMKCFALLLTVGTFGWMPCIAQTKGLVLNGSFEVDELFCTSCYRYAISGWTVGPRSGIFKPSSTQFPNGVPDGVNVAFLGDSESTGSIRQSLGIAVQPNKTYTLTLSIGKRADIPFAPYLAAIIAGGETLASDNTLQPASGTFVEDVIVYRSGPNPPLAGYPIGILVKSFQAMGSAGQVEVDKISITVE